MSKLLLVIGVLAVAALVLVWIALPRDGTTALDPAVPQVESAARAPASTAPMRTDAVSAEAEHVTADGIAAEGAPRPPAAAPRAQAETSTSSSNDLRRAALVARVLDANDKPIARARVRLARESAGGVPPGDPRSNAPDGPQAWALATDDAGRCSASGLPCDVRLRVEIAREGSAAALEQEAITLTAGETRRLEWRVLDGCTISGRVLDQDGKPVPDLELLVQRPLLGLTPEYAMYEESGIVMRGRADKSGRFTLKAVPAGTWWLGPEPPGGPNQNTRSVAGTALEVEASPRSERNDVVLHVDQNLTIRGRVLDPSGAPAARQWITAKEVATEIPVAVMSESDGAFTVGPLRRGIYELYVGGGGEASEDEFFAPSKPVTARAGEEGLVLELELGGSIHGRIVDRRTGTGVQAQLWLSPRGASPIGLVEGTSTGDGSFRLGHLNAGTYDIGVQSQNQLCGTSTGIRVEAGAQTRDVVIALDPSAMLLVRYEGARERASVSVKLDGARIPGGGVLMRGMSLNLVVPGGRSILEVYLLGKGQLPDRPIEATAGEVRELVITDSE